MPRLSHFLLFFCTASRGGGGAGRTRKSSQVELVHSSLEEIELAEQAATVFGSMVVLVLLSMFASFVFEAGEITHRPVV